MFVTLICQPPTARSTALPAPLRNFFPFPKGSSYVTVLDQRKGVSDTARLYSASRLYAFCGMAEAEPKKLLLANSLSMFSDQVNADRNVSPEDILFWTFATRES